jgi:hypothetical protein
MNQNGPPLRRPALAAAPFQPHEPRSWSQRPSVIQAHLERERARDDPDFGAWLAHLQAGRIGARANAAAAHGAAEAPAANTPAAEAPAPAAPAAPGAQNNPPAPAAPAPGPADAA